MLRHDELKKKLIQIGYDGSKPGDAKIVEALTAAFLTLDEYGLSDHEKQTVLDLIRETALEELSSTPEMSDEKWEDFNYGNVKFGDFVRVKKDAYDSETGAKHNGLVGTLTSGSYGRYVVTYVGISSGKTMRHPMGMLESLKMR